MNLLRELESKLLEKVLLRDKQARYDKEALELLSNKCVMARILKHVVDEVHDYSEEEIQSMIEGTVSIKPNGVYPGTKILPKIIGLSNESKIIDEGIVKFDLRFNLDIPNEPKTIRVIVNVEAQNKTEGLGYNLVTRVIYYLCRLISEQAETEFDRSNYDDIKKVYSIWICMPKDRKSSIESYSIKRDIVYGEYSGDDRYDIMKGVVIRLGNNYQNDPEFLEQLSIIFSDRIAAEVKLQKLKEVGIPSGALERISEMSNLGRDIYDEGVRDASIEIAKAMLAKGISDDDIIEFTKLSDDEIQKLKEELSKQG